MKKSMISNNAFVFNKFPSFFLHSFFLIFILSFAQCVIAQTPIRKPLEAFNRIRVANQSQLLLVPSDSSILDITLQNIPADKVITEVSDGEFSIRTKGMHNLPMIKGSLYFSQPLEKISATLSGWVKSEQKIKSHRLEIEVKIDGYIHVIVDVDELFIVAGQGSIVQVEGNARFVQIDANSGATVRTGDLKCTDAQVTSAMGAEVWLSATKDYTAKALTGGIIYYKTEPSGTFHRTESSGGKILQ